MRQNENVAKFEYDKMQLHTRHNAFVTKGKGYKMQIKQKANVTKSKWDKMQIGQYANET